jgi:hypothetical protein
MAWLKPCPSRMAITRREKPAWILLQAGESCSKSDLISEPLESVLNELVQKRVRPIGRCLKNPGWRVRLDQHESHG